MIKDNSVIQLNLARKWRSQQFSTIIGQDLVVRILKNSLYASSFFPVYLFSGTRGCGKTTTARVFAAAINCENLEGFQQNPTKTEIPCLKCRSCILMKQSKHPDFIEMDAASHTGVDNVRDIIEAASLLPTVGRKRIYLIDEAHMLSKAAFNAFLKILEEPPSSVLFILATTERQKVIETVRSRCFQLFFQAVEPDVLVSHLKNVCDAESISYDEQGLELVAREATGSVRDALNVLERVRFSVEKISRQAVLANLQHVDDALLLDLIESVCRGDRFEVVALFEKAQFEKYGQAILWQKIISILQNIIWSAYGITRSNLVDLQGCVKKMADSYHVDIFIYMLEKFYQHEQIFLRTTAQSTLIQVLFLGLCEKKTEIDQNRASASRQKNIISKRPGAVSASSSPRLSKSTASELKTQKTMPQEVSAQEPPIQAVSTREPSAQVRSEDVGLSDERWGTFLNKINGKIEDPLANSIIGQACFVSFENSRLVVNLALPKKLSFFKDSFMAAQKIWQPILNEIFAGAASKAVSCELQFNKEEVVGNKVVNKSADVERSFSQSTTRSFEKKTSSTVMVGPSRQHLKNGKHARALLQYFPGSLSLVRHENE